jgi:hypothetical protein
MTYTHADAPPAWQLNIAPGPSQRLARAYLWLGVAALIGSGVLAIVLVLSRTPGISTTFPLRDLFKAALVVHVDLSVLIWFMAFAGVVWSLATAPRWVGLGWLAWGLASGGTLAMAVSPFLPNAQPLLNNYIPILDQPVFLAGLSLCGLGFGLTILRTLVWGWGTAGELAQARALHRGVMLSALAGGMAWVALGWTSLQQAAGAGVAHYELMFWGPGHVLQFQHALLAAVAWLWLAGAVGAPTRVRGATVQRLFMLAALPLLAAPLIYLLWPAGTGEHVKGFADLMRHGHVLSLPLVLIALAVLPRVWRQTPSPARSALLASVLLFSVGGVLAFMIRGINVVVPAHYHGSIVGVTLAFMGLSYVLLPRLGFGEADGRMARWQPWVYGGGQLTHILGLAWSGGYGVQRKVAGAEQVLVSLPQKLGMGMMGLGGLIAVVGGVMFVLVCLKAMRQRG